MLNALLAILLVCYPLLVFFGLDRLGVSTVAFLIAGLFVARLLFVHRERARLGELAVPMLWIAGPAAAFGGVVLLSNESRLLLLYPVVVSLAFLAVFAASLFQGRPMIERFARISEPDLNEPGVRYTRQATVAWCFFFVPMPGSASARCGSDDSTFGRSIMGSFRIF